MCRIRPYFSAVHYLALVCEESTIEQRLWARPPTRTGLTGDFERYLESQVAVDREYRARAEDDPTIVLLNSSAQSTDGLADRAADWVRTRLKR